MCVCTPNKIIPFHSKGRVQKQKCLLESSKWNLNPPETVKSLPYSTNQSVFLPERNCITLLPHLNLISHIPAHTPSDRHMHMPTHAPWTISQIHFTENHTPLKSTCSSNTHHDTNKIQIQIYYPNKPGLLIPPKRYLLLYLPSVPSLYNKASNGQVLWAENKRGLQNPLCSLLGHWKKPAVMYWGCLQALKKRFIGWAAKTSCLACQQLARNWSFQQSHTGVI